MFLLMKPLISTGSATAFAVCSLACAIAPAQAAETVRKSYDIAGGDAVNTLKRFADESGRQVVFLVDAVRGVTTNPVRGEYSAREALTRLVAETGLAFAEDGTLWVASYPTGAITRFNNSAATGRTWRVVD